MRQREWQSPVLRVNEDDVKRFMLTAESNM